MQKIELQKIMKQNKSRFTVYKIDKIAKQHGQKVLCLSPYHCNFNMIGLMCSQVKSYIANSNKKFKLKDVIVLVLQSIENITPELSLIHI